MKLKNLFGESSSSIRGDIEMLTIPSPKKIR